MFCMFYMIYGTFIQSPYFWYLIYGRQNTPPPFLVFIVSGVSWTQIIKGKIPRQFFIRRRAVERRPKRGRPRGPNGVGPRGQVQGPCGTHQTGPRALPRMGLFMYAFVFAEKGRPNFSRIIWSWGGGTPDPLRRGSDPAAPELRRGGKSPPSSSPLLLGVGGGLSITSTISIIISVIHSVPLIVWELLYTRS